MTDRLDTMAMFVAVAELGSFAEAARRLNRDPAAVTRAVAALEADLRVRLLNRTTRSVALTDEGGRFLDGCRRLLASYDDLRAQGDGARAEPHGAISVTTTGMFGRLHVLPSIVRFMERYPRVDVRAMFVDRIVSLVDEGLDVGVRLGKLPDSSLRATRVGQVYLSVYASPDYLARHGEPLSPRDLIDHQTVSCLTISPIPDRWSFDGADVTNVPVKPRLVVNSIESAADAVAEGAGLTFLASYHAHAYVQAGRLRRVLAAWEPAPIPIHILQPAGRFPAVKVRLFVDHLAADLRRRFATARRDAEPIALDSGSAA
jgi:DNA-binding transcriptional LysR family regulator